MQTVNDIRKSFLAYFEQNQHEIVASSSLVPMNDPTLLFTNAGMVQFKNVFTGGETRDVPRAVTSQKCVRAGGKHNDLENVGHTARHHTFFEMLGNFSFGDYFKEEAIYYAWTLITDIYGLPKDRLLVTIYHDDDEAAAWWKKIAGLGDDKIIRIATSDNFWSMGDTGPCGPCSEIFYDHGDHIQGGPPGTADEDGDRFIEIWNLVFMQYEQLPDGTRISLPKPSIDTGMGLERIAATMQGFHDNYATDMMQALINASAEVSAVAADGEHAVSHRVIADHLRASAFLIADGVLPSNEGRGYVLRRIMRRAMRHAHQMGCIKPMMHRLVPALVQEMGGHFTELLQAEKLITETLEMEETRFKETLGRGLKILVDTVEGMAEGGTLNGETAFKLYDTYGFPLDLTQDVMRGYDWKVDLDGFHQAMEKQKAQARAAWAGSGDTALAGVYLTLAEEVGATEFLGYELDEAEGQIVGLVAGDTRVDTAQKGEEVQIITNQTTFYAESGGQMGDQGVLAAPQNKDDILAEVTDTWKTPSGMFVHTANLKADIALGDHVMMMIDAPRRELLRANHSATHLMHEALREVLGEHVMQKGSLVAPDRLRFDFSHTKQVAPDELKEVETIVNERIRMNSEVTTRLMTPDAAIEEGALALFGEKYGDEVRVVSMGGESKSDGRSQWSVELCGGTHVRQTGAISLFQVTAETSVAGGVRRIEAVTSQGAKEWVKERLDMLEDVARDAKTLLEQVKNTLAELLAHVVQAASDSKISPEKVKSHILERFIEVNLADISLENLPKLVNERVNDRLTVHDATLQGISKLSNALAESTGAGEKNDLLALVGQSNDYLVMLEKIAVALKVSPKQVKKRFNQLLTDHVETLRRISELSKSRAENTETEDQILYQKAIERVDGYFTMLERARLTPNMSPDEVAGNVEALLAAHNKALQRVSELNKSLAEAGDNGGEAAEIGGISFETRMLDGIPAKELKSIAEGILKKMQRGVVAVISADDGKASIVVAVTDELTDRLDAVALVRVGASALGGTGGGGRPDMAQAGGPDVGKAETAFSAIAEAIKENC